MAGLRTGMGHGHLTVEFEPLELLNAANTPRTKRTIGIFAYDVESDGVTDLSAPIPQFFAQPFITGVDLYVPASSRPDRPISVVSRPRGGAGHIDALMIPSWPSSENRISVQLDDYVR
jgi:hypothetical protein